MIPWDKVGTALINTKMDRLPNSLSFFLILQACLEEGCGTQVAPWPPHFPAVLSLCLGPATSHPLGMKAESFTHPLDAKLLMCSRELLAEQRPSWAAPEEQMCCPASSCRRSGFKITCSGWKYRNLPVSHCLVITPDSSALSLAAS